MANVLDLVYNDLSTNVQFVNKYLYVILIIGYKKCTYNHTALSPMTKYKAKYLEIVIKDDKIFEKIYLNKIGF